MDTASERRALWWLAGIVAFSIIARLYNLSSWDLWTDEVQTMLTSADLAFKEGPMYRTAPVNFLITGVALELFGHSITTARASSFVAGVLTVPLTYAFAARRFGTRAALFAAALIGLSMWHVFWSQTARHFALETLLLLGAAHLLLRHLERERGVAYAAFASLLMVAALFTHSSAGFYVGTLLLYAAWCWRDARRAAQAPGSERSEANAPRPARGRPFVPAPRERTSAIAVAACALPLAVYVPVYVSLSRYLLENKAPWNPWWNIVGSLSFYVPPGVAIAGAGGALALWLGRDRRGVLLAGLFLIPAALVVAASTQTIASAAYVLPGFPAVAALVGVAADRVLAASHAPAARAAAVGLVAVVFATQAYQLAHYYLFYNGLKPRWEEATAYVAEHRGPNEKLYASEGDVAVYYLGEGGADWLGALPEDEPGDVGRWFAVYMGERLTSDSERISALLADAELMATFPLHYGSKGRTIGVYYMPPEAAAAEAGWEPDYPLDVTLMAGGARYPVRLRSRWTGRGAWTGILPATHVRPTTIARME